MGIISLAREDGVQLVHPHDLEHTKADSSTHPAGPSSRRLGAAIAFGRRILFRADA